MFTLRREGKVMFGDVDLTEAGYIRRDFKNEVRAEKPCCYYGNSALLLCLNEAVPF